MNPLSHHAQRVLLHPSWLIAALSAAVFFQFALNRGGVESAIWIAGFFLGVHAIAGAFDLRRLPRRECLFLAAVASLLLISWVFAPEATDTARTGRIVKFAILILSVSYLAQIGLGRGLKIWVTTLAVTIVLWQFAARHFGASPYGTFNNPHYIAYFMALLLPLLVLSASWFEWPYRYLIYLVLPLDLELIFNECRNLAIPVLAIGAAFGALAWRLASRRARWAVIGASIALAVAAVVLINPPPHERADGASPSDERVQLWIQSLHMLQDNDTRHWLLGNGIGSFRHEFRNYFPPQFSDLPFPHNHFLELLYENGLLVTAMITGFLVYLGWRSLQLTESLADPDLRALARCNLSAFAIWFVFTFLAFGVYSRYTLYPFGIMIGVFFFFTQQPERRAPEPKPADGRAGTL